LAPPVALHALRRVVSTLRSTLRGALLTLKLNDWGMASDVPRWLDLLAEMGFDSVRATQLCSNRQEICVAAQRRAR
jgi:23S rRNA (cytidine2498-2'-O)-methyltransferase